MLIQITSQKFQIRCLLDQAIWPQYLTGILLNWSRVCSTIGAHLMEPRLAPLTSMVCNVTFLVLVRYTVVQFVTLL